MRGGYGTWTSARTARGWSRRPMTGLLRLDARTGQPLTRPIRHQGRGDWCAVQPGRFAGGDRLRGWGQHRPGLDARTGEPVTDPLPHGWYMPSVQFSPDGSRVATAFVSQAARVWDARTGQPVTEPIPHDGFVGFLSSAWTARAPGDGLRGPYCLGRPHRSAGVQGPATQAVRSARFSPDGSRVVTASDDQTARVSDARTGEPPTEPLRHRGPVSSAQFGPDGSRVVTASKDHTARVWDARSGQPVGDPLGHDGEGAVARVQPGRWLGGDGIPTDGPAPAWSPHVAGTGLVPRLGRGQGGTSLRQRGRNRGHSLGRAATAAGTGPGADRRGFLHPPGAVGGGGSDHAHPLAQRGLVTVPEHVRRLIDADTVASLREALALSPGESEAWGWAGPPPGEGGWGPGAGRPVDGSRVARPARTRTRSPATGSPARSRNGSVAAPMTGAAGVPVRSPACPAPGSAA